MEITVLMDNLTYKNNLIAEHGFAYLIEDDKLKYLLDTGQSKNFIENAKNLNIKVEEIDYLIISHGHYDHTGGMEEFLKINSKAKIICKKEIFIKKYSKTTGNIREIGITFNIEKYKDRFVFLNENYELSKNIKVIAKIQNSIKANKNFFVLDENNELIQDKFSDEIFLLLNNNAVLSACSHNGVVEIIEEAKKYGDINTFIGGMHLSKESDKKVNKIADTIKSLGITNIITGHCTGVEAFSIFKNKIEKVSYASCGNKVEV